MIPDQIAAPLSHGSNPNSNMAGRRREDDINIVEVARSLNSQRDGYNDGSDQTYVVPALTSKMAKGTGGPAGDECQNLVLPISQDALRGEGVALTPSPDAEGRVRLRDPGFSIGKDGDPAFTLAASGPGAVGIAEAVNIEHGLAPHGSLKGRDTVAQLGASEGKGHTIVRTFNVTPEGGQGADLRATETDTSLWLSSLNGQAHDRVSLVASLAPSITASNDPSRSPQSSEVTQQVESVARAGAGVRRLTPTECERLQGLPDGWTLPGPDSRRYAGLGDAVTANVGEWIGRRLLAAEEAP